MEDYIIGNSSNLSGRQIGLNWISRLSTLSLATGQPIDWHAHESLEILVCHRGAPLYEFERHSTQTLRAGCFLVVPPHLRHRIHNGIDTPVWRSSIFLRPPGNGRKRPDFFTEREYRDIFAALLKHRLAPSRLPFFREREMQRMSNLIRLGSRISGMELAELRALIVTTVIALANATRTNPSAGDSADLIEEAKLWLEKRLDQRVNLDDLVGHIGYGRSRFFALFREETGLTPLKWLTQRRMEKAKEMLDREPTSISTLARRVGFSSSNFFAKTFRAYTGQTPANWRKTNRTQFRPSYSATHS